jgi:hypothetical protein
MSYLQAEDARTAMESINPEPLETETDLTMQWSMATIEAVETSDFAHFILWSLPGGGAPERREIGAEPVVVGRVPSADLCVPNVRISRRHCRLQVVDGQLTVEDLGSTNGTLLGDRPVQGRVVVPNDSRLLVGDCVLTHEYRSRREVARTVELQSEMRRAVDYVLALLPPPCAAGPVRTDWSFVPSSALGGDAFGYCALDAGRHAIYLLDVCGHGAGAAMHSVSAINVLRHRNLPGVDFARPAEVLAALNAAFQMDEHNGMYFTLWYGVYDAAARRLEYASAGHPPALIIAGGEAQSLQTRGLPIGAFPQAVYRSAGVAVPPGARLHVFSDGVFEIVTGDGSPWSLDQFVELVLERTARGAADCAGLQEAVRGLSRDAELPDDFSLLIAEFS